MQSFQNTSLLDGGAGQCRKVSPLRGVRTSNPGIYMVRIEHSIRQLHVSSIDYHEGSGISTDSKSESTSMR